MTSFEPTQDDGDGIGMSPLWPNVTPGPDGTAQVPQYPPYIPESKVDLQHLPESTLDGIHGDGGVIRMPPGSKLGPAPTPDGPRYTQPYGPDDPELSRIWVPDRRPAPPGSVLPASNSTGNSKPFQVDYAELEKFAQQHDLNAEEVQKWAAMDQDFPEEYLRTHGKVNYGTYLKIKEFMASKLAAGTAYADRQIQTAEKVRNVVTTVSNIDSASGTDVRGAATEVRQA